MSNRRMHESPVVRTQVFVVGPFNQSGQIAGGPSPAAAQRLCCLLRGFSNDPKFVKPESLKARTRGCVSQLLEGPRNLRDCFAAKQAVGTRPLNNERPNFPIRCLMQ